MTDAPERLTAFRVMLIDQRLRPASPHHIQAEVVVAAKSMKEAAEIIGGDVRSFRENGGATGQKPVIAMCMAEPRVPFVEFGHGQYRRLSEVDDPTKTIVLDMKDEDLYGRDTQHPAFGMVTMSRLSGGDGNLFMVDYPTGGSIRLTISTATLNRNLASDRIMDDRDIIVVEMSEVQWARIVSSFNVGGVPVTLRRYRDPLTGEYMTPKMPDRHAGNVDTFRKEIEDKAAKTVREVTEAHDRLAEILKGPLRKGDLQEVLDMLRSACMASTNGLPFVAEQAHEAIDTATQHAKAEVDAHIDNAMMKLGERALGSQLQAAIEAGADPRDIGKALLTFINPPQPAADDRLLSAPNAPNQD